MSKEIDEIDEFIELFNDFKNIQQQQKMRGLNDFNIFTTVLKKHDEVRLHSRFLTFLLDPNANHCQGDLFLNLFLQEIGLKDFFTDLNDCTAYGEYENIDIYISDGNKHIIIENKIWAGDQKKQIKRYIKTINDENEELDNDNIVVVYLSVDRKTPSNYSLFNSEKECKNGFAVEGEKLIGKGDCKEQEYQFINLNYNNQISKWLEKSHQQIANITNLSVGITQYQEVIAKLYGKYKEKVMDLKEYLKNKENKAELVQTMGYISEEYQDYRVKVIHEFFEKSIKLLKDKFKQDENWQVKEVGDKLKTGKSYDFPLRIRQNENSKVLFGFEFDSRNYHDSTFGIVRLNNSVDFKQLKENENIKKILEDKNLKTKNSKWWLYWDYYHEDDIFDKIIADGNDAEKKFVDAFMGIFDNYKDVVIECNKELDKPQ